MRRKITERYCHVMEESVSDEALVDYENMEEATAVTPISEYFK